MKKAKQRLGLFGKLFALIIAVYAAMMMITLQAEMNEMKRQRQMLEGQLENQRVLNAYLEEAIASSNTEDALERVAWERLGMVYPGEKVIYNQTP